MSTENYLLDFYVKHNGKTITPELAHEIVKGFPVTDGSERQTGEKWTLSETTDVGNKLGVNWDKVQKSEFYLVMNSMYSDYYNVGRKHGLTDHSFYAELTQSWFNDKDGKENKTFYYFVM